MKKIFSGLLTGIIVTSIIVSDVKAQMSLASMSSSKTKAIPAGITAAEDKSAGDEKNPGSKDNIKQTKANLKAAKVNFKAMKANFKAAENFRKEFKDGPDVKWQVETNVISAYFDRDDIQTRVIYNKRGNWIHTISYFEESKMPKEIKSLIRSNYPDYNIKGINEIKEGDMTFHIVYLDDETSIKQVCVCNGEMKVYKEFTKQR